jgi:hypothetical protein
MHRSTLIFVLSATVLIPALRAQTPAPDLSKAVPACLSAASLDQLPSALDDAISGPGDKDRTCLRNLMSPDVRLVLMSPNGSRLFTLDDWINAMQRRGSTAMFERQVKIKTESFGRIAHLWCTYEIRTSADGKATTRGLNSIQATFDGERWTVINVVWQAETPTETIPEKYLP